MKFRCSACTQKRVPLARFPNSTSRDRTAHLVPLARRWSLRRETSSSGTRARGSRMPPFKTCHVLGRGSVWASRSVRSLPMVVTRRRVARRSCNVRQTCITTTASSSGKQIAAKLAIDHREVGVYVSCGRIREGARDDQAIADLAGYPGGFAGIRRSECGATILWHRGEDDESCGPLEDRSNALGDPDLQGAWTSDSARGIPRERPEQFAGRAELTDQEYADRVARDEQTINNALNASGVQTGGRDGAWRGSQTFRQTSLLVDPPDGRMPPLTAEALKRSAPRDRGSFGGGPFDSPEDFTLYDRCITRGIVGGVLPVPLTATGIGSSRRRTPSSSTMK